MKRGVLIMALCLAACGDPRRDDPPDGDSLIRATLGAINGAGVDLYAFAVRVSSVRVKMSSGRDITTGPKNVDVASGGLLFEVRSDATPREIELRFDEPPQGSGVVPGARVAVYLSCGVDDDQVDFHGDELDDVTLDVSKPHIALRFDLNGVFDGIDLDDLDDDDDNDAAELLEERLAASLRLCDECD